MKEIHKNAKGTLMGTMYCTNMGVQTQPPWADLKC